MSRGRKPKPTNLKLIEGNPGRRPLNRNEPKPTPIAPKPPAWLAPQAKKLWKALAPQLEKLGLLTKIDGAAFEAVCQEYAIWVQCELYLKKAGRTTVMNRKSEWDEDREGNIVEHVTDSGYEQQRPEVAIGNKALAALKAFCTEFGLTPSSRSRINLPAPDEETDPMEALLKRSGG